MVIRKNNKNMYARLDKDNNLVITAPLFVSSSVIEKFAKESYDKLQKRKEKRPTKSIFNKDGQIKILGEYKNIDNFSELNSILLVSLKNYLNNTDRSIVKRDNIYLLNRVRISCCLIECGFMSNKEELVLLQDEKYQYKFAEAILMGVNNYLK